MRQRTRHNFKIYFAAAFLFMCVMVIKQAIPVRADGTKAVTVEKGTAVTKTYDGTPDAMAAVSADNYVLNGIEGGDDVQLTYQGAEFNEAGTEAAYVTLTGLGLTGKDASKYILNSGTATLDGSISKYILTPDNVRWSVPDSWEYDNQTHWFSPVVDPTGNFYMEVDYTLYNSVGQVISNEKVKDAGTYKAVCNGIVSDYAWYMKDYDDTALVGYEKTFIITGRELTESMLQGFEERVAHVSTLSSTGSYPQYILADGDDTLKKDKDYTVKYSGKGTLAGHYTMTITGKGKYSGTIEKNYDVYYEKYTGNLLPELPADCEFYTQGFSLKLPAGTTVGKTDSGSFTSRYKVTEDGVNVTQDVYVKVNYKIYTYSFSYSMDSVMPEVSLVDFDADADCYLDQILNITEDNIKKVELIIRDNRANILVQREIYPEADGRYHLRIDKSVTAPSGKSSDYLYYDIKVTDKAGLWNYGLGNYQLGVHVYPISRMYDKITDGGILSETTVTSDDRQALETTLAKYKSLPVGSGASDEQKEEIDFYEKIIQKLLDKISAVEKEIKEIRDFHDATDTNKVTTDQMAAIKAFCGRVENLLEENNLTSGERSSLEKINQALQAEYAKVVSVKQELEEIEEKMSSMSENSVTKDDLTALDQLLSDTIRMELDYSNHMTEKQKASLQEWQKEILAMEKRIDEAENCLSGIGGIDRIDTGHLEKDDLEALKDLQAVVNTVEKEYKGNLNTEGLAQFEEWKKTINDSIKEIETKLKLIEETDKLCGEVFTAVTEENVNSDSRNKLQKLLESIKSVEKLGTDYLTSDENSMFMQREKVAEALIQKLDDVQKEKENLSELIKINLENMKKEDLEKLKENIAGIERLENAIGGNLTEEEKAELSEAKKELQSCVEGIEKVQKIENELIEILKKETLSEQDRKRVKELQEMIGQLYPGERRIFDVTLQDRAVQKASKSVTAGVNTGDPESGMAWMLMLLCGALFLGTVVYKKKEQNV